MTDFMTGHNHSITITLNLIKNKLSLNQVEVMPLKTPFTLSFYEKWLANNYHGNMAYLQTHLPFKQNPHLLESKLKSVISIAQSYFPTVQPPNLKTPARVALYAHNEDYHFWLKQKLNEIITSLKVDFPDEIFLPYVDSGPILERDMGFQNGLGWFGKNTCLIHPEHGSLFFIAEILTTLNLNSESSTTAPLPDFCGTCTRCIDICPTGALIAPRTLKADQCISYLTIESKTAPPIELRKKIGDWFFGCDLCQTICPWNDKFFRKKKIEKSDQTSTLSLLQIPPQNRNDLIDYFRFLLNSSHNKIQKFHYGSPLLRAGAKGLKRNALIVIANQNLIELKSDVENVTTDELKELVNWTLQQLK